MTSVELTDFARRRVSMLLEQWWQVAPAPDGLLQPTHGPAWERVDDRRRSLVSQSRFTHNFAQGWRLMGDARWREATRMAVQGLLRGFPLTPCGLPVFCIDESGEVLDDRVWPYGVAFALFALAQGATVDDDPEIPATAERWWEALLKLRDEHGGWVWMYSPEGRADSREWTHNSIMHLCEATLAWSRIDTRWRRRAEEILAFMQTHLLGPDRQWVPEFSDENWQPSTEPGQDYISIGHQWEWAHLHVQAHAAGLAGGDLDLARALADTARRLGLPAPDLVVAMVKADGTPLPSRPVYWDYCEAARACVWLTAKGVAPEYYDLLPGILHGLETRFYDDRHHGYVTCGDQPVESARKGEAWRVDYHQIGLFADLIDLAPELPQRVIA